MRVLVPVTLAAQVAKDGLRMAAKTAETMNESLRLRIDCGSMKAYATRKLLTTLRAIRARQSRVFKFVDSESSIADDAETAYDPPRIRIACLLIPSPPSRGRPLAMLAAL